LDFGKFADTLEVHALLLKKTAQIPQGHAAHPSHSYAQALI
jgi:hypothetical protein